MDDGMKNWYDLAEHCPLCKGEASCFETFFVPKMSDFPDVYTICCGDCGIDVCGETAEEALEIWNRRTPHD